MHGCPFRLLLPLPRRPTAPLTGASSWLQTRVTWLPPRGGVGGGLHTLPASGPRLRPAGPIRDVSWPARGHQHRTSRSICQCYWEGPASGFLAEITGRRLEPRCLRAKPVEKGAARAWRQTPPGLGLGTPCAAALATVRASWGSGERQVAAPGGGAGEPPPAPGSPAVPRQLSAPFVLRFSLQKGRCSDLPLRCLAGLRGETTALGDISQRHPR